MEGHLIFSASFSLWLSQKLELALKYANTFTSGFIFSILFIWYQYTDAKKWGRGAVQQVPQMFSFFIQGMWTSATKAKLQNAEMPREVQMAEIMIQEHQEIGEDIKAHKPK